LQKGAQKDLELANRSLTGEQSRAAVLGPNPADSLAGDEGKQGEGHEEIWANLLVALEPEGVVGRGPAMELCSKRRRRAAATVRRRR